MSRRRTLWIAVSACLVVAGCGQETAFEPHAGSSTARTMPVDSAAADALDASVEYGMAGEESTPAAWGGAAEFAEPSSPAADGGESAIRDPMAESPAEYGEEGVSRQKAHDATPAGRNRQISSGILTAGSFDDHRQYESYCTFLTNSLQNDPGEFLPRLAIGQRVMIQVTDGQGQPVLGARVSVSALNRQQQQRPLIELPTGSDGRAVFLTAMDGRGAYAEEYQVCVTPADGGKPVTMRAQANGEPWHVVLPDTDSLRPVRLDLALVVDTTGSMGDELEYLKSEIDDIAATIHRMFPNVDQRYALVVYRDQGDQYVTRNYDFTDSLSDFRSALSTQRANGGGDYPEAMHTALENAAALSWRGRDTARVLFLVGDAPPHDRFAGRTLDAVQSLRAQGVRIFPVAASGVAWKAEFVMRAAAFLTMGQYLFLTDHSGVGNAHATPHVPEYQVEHLNRLMVRMIAEQLAGKHLAPQEVIAIEQGDLQPLQFQPLQFQPLTWQCRQPPMPVACYQPPHRTRVLSLAAMLPSFASLRPFRWVLLGFLVSGLIVFDMLRLRWR